MSTLLNGVNFDYFTLVKGMTLVDGVLLYENRPVELFMMQQSPIKLNGTELYFQFRDTKEFVGIIVVNNATKTPIYDGINNTKILVEDKEKLYQRMYYLTKRKVKNVKKELRTCPMCGKQVRNYKNREYCASCSQALQKQAEKQEKAKNKTEKVCPVCGKKFIATSSIHTYCSHECYVQYAKERYVYHAKLVKEPIIRTCPICGKEFLFSQSHRKYCSTKCKQKASTMSQGIKPAIGSTQTCLTCGKEFEVTKSRYKFCSTECYREYYSGKITEPTKRICPICGKEFVSSHPTKKYCCHRCHQQAYNIRRRKS